MTFSSEIIRKVLAEECKKDDINPVRVFELATILKFSRKPAEKA